MLVDNITVYSIPGFREPVNSFTHLIAAAVFVGLTILLLRQGRENPRRTIALGVFGLSSVLLLCMSSIYHMLWPGSGRQMMERLDIAAIFVLIAGTFTPAYAILYQGTARFRLLVLIWGAAISGITLRTIFFETLSGWWGTGLFLAFGWIGAVSAWDLWKRYSFDFIKPLVWGGLAYTSGAMLLEFHWPTLIPRILGPHELWHIAVLIGLGFHWRFVWQFAHGEPNCPQIASKPG
jgi:channel protein (hemolysin III family)